MTFTRPLVTAAAMMFVCAGCDDSSTVTLSDLQAKVGPDAVIEMTSDQFPAFHRTLGPERFRQANELGRWAAIVAAESPSCDHVEIVGLSDRSTRGSLEWFVDCKNGERFRPTEDEAAEARRRWRSANGGPVPTHPAQPKSASLADISDADATQMCATATSKINGSHSTLVGTEQSWTVRRHPVEGRLSVENEFAKTAPAESGIICLIDAAERRVIEVRAFDPESGWRVVRE